MLLRFETAAVVLLVLRHQKTVAVPAKSNRQIRSAALQNESGRLSRSVVISAGHTEGSSLASAVVLQLPLPSNTPDTSNSNHVRPRPKRSAKEKAKGLIPKTKEELDEEKEQESLSGDSATPDVSIDYRDSDRLTDVKDQGDVNACWAFAVRARFAQAMLRRANRRSVPDAPTLFPLTALLFIYYVINFAGEVSVLDYLNSDGILTQKSAASDVKGLKIRKRLRPVRVLSELCQAKLPSRSTSDWSARVASASKGRPPTQKQLRRPEITFSEQFLLDCNMDWTNRTGGAFSSALKMLKQGQGIPLASDWRPYNHSSDGPAPGQQAACLELHRLALRNQLIDYEVKGKDTIKIRAGSDEEDNMVATVSKFGPIAAGVFSTKAFEEYDGSNNGFFETPPECTGGEDPNHAVLLVGYGVDTSTDEDRPYWIIKNSWGRDWGVGGYANVSRGTNFCSITKHVLHLSLEWNKNMSQPCDGSRCGCDQGHCFKRPFYDHPAMSKRDLWCYTQNVGTPPNRKDYACCKRHEGCDFIMECGSCMLYRGNDAAFAYNRSAACP